MLQISGLSLTYPEKPNLFDGLEFSLQPSEILLVQGPNGSGKTSLLNAIAGIIPEHVKAELGGSITLNGQDLRALPLREHFRHLSYQMSDPDTQTFFPQVTKELAFALENLGLDAAEMRRRIYAAAEFFGLDGLLSREPGTLSLGQKKLLLFAVCEALATRLVLLDEPSVSLGERALQTFRAWLERLSNSGRLVILADHAPAVQALATRSLSL